MDMSRKILSFILFLVISSLFAKNVSAQATEEWSAIAGFATGYAFNNMVIDQAGNVYVAGGISNDFGLIKYDTNGNQLWLVRYNGPGNYIDKAIDIALDQNGNIYITGFSTGNGTGFDYAVIKYDPNGNQLWAARYDGPSNNHDIPTSLALDQHGNIYVTGLSGSIGYSFSSFDYLHGVDTFADYITVKYDTNGNQQWVARYNGPGNSKDIAMDIAVDVAGDLYVTGQSYGSGTLADYATIKYDTNGNELWVARYNGTGNSYDQANALTIDKFGNIVLTGSSYASAPSIFTAADYTTIKYDANGNQLWAARYNYAHTDIANALITDQAGNIYITGTSGGESATIKYDPNGNPLWAARYRNTGSNTSNDSANAITIDYAGNVYITGGTSDNNGPEGITTLKYDPNGNLLWYVVKSRIGATGVQTGRAISVDQSGYIYVSGVSGGFVYTTVKYKDAPVSTLSFSAEPGFFNGFEPETGTATTNFTFKAIYTGPEIPLSYIRVCIDNICNNMSLDAGAATTLKDGLFANGEQYAYATTLPAGAHTFYFEASDGTNMVMLPSTGSLPGPTVSNLSISTISLNDGMAGVPYTSTLIAVGGTGPYTWNIGSLPVGLSFNSSTGVISGTPTVPGTYTFTVEVTDYTGAVYSRLITFTVAADVVPPTGSISILGGNLYLNNVNITLNLSCSDPQTGCADMRFSNDGITWSAYEPFAATRAWTLDAGDGSKTVYIELRDGAGNVTTYSVMTTLDTTGPVMTAPTSPVSNVSGWNNTDVTVNISAVDATSATNEIRYSINGGPEVIVSGGLAPITLINEGDATITYYSIDTVGNACSPQTLIVRIDKTAPSLVLPAGVSINATGSGTVANYSVTVIDNFDLAPLVTCIPASGSAFQIGATLVSCTAVDAAGNISSGSFNVTVTDITAPVITVSDVTMTVTNGALTPLSSIAPTAIDNVDGSITPVASISEASLAPGVYYITWTATDSSGNSATAAQRVVINTPSSVYGLSVPGGGQLNISTSADQMLSGVVVNSLLTVNPPAGVLFNYGSVSFGMTSAMGGSGTTELIFSPVLPASIALYLIDGNGNGVEIPSSLWTRTDGPNGTVITVSLTDGSQFDLNPQAGIIGTNIVVGYVFNKPPVADGGVDRSISCIGMVCTVTLDGTGSTDPEGAADITSYSWYENYATNSPQLLGTGASLTTSLSLGEHVITLVVEDTVGHVSTDTFTVAVNPAALSLFDIKKAEVKWDKKKIKLAGKIALPVGRAPQDVSAKGLVSIDLSTLGTVLNESVIFQVKDRNMKWEYEAANKPLTGIETFMIDWEGAKFDYTQGGLSIKSHHIGQDSSKLEIDREGIIGPQTISIGGFTINIDGSVVTASSPDVKIDIDKDGEIEVVLPVAIAHGMTMTLGGAVTGTINVADYYTAAVGKFRIEAGFSNNVDPSALDRLLSARVTLGDEKFPGTFTINPVDWKSADSGEWKYKKE